ncbi:hypothetical protein CUJ91_32220 (plasmid) [Paraburkholderia graminis]|uniref:hypothetical protein n=1 Tax=Paraburkholderia graminis TaxID=60548 RepID=UPI000DEFEC24|nr:hypothetical protein [Paraburkholderia graminis]AXF12666.1 hypothetical protein CUJ91_32220 [Paraburkholderia graminis]
MQFGDGGQFSVDDRYVVIQSFQLQPSSNPVGALYYSVRPLCEREQCDIAALYPNDNVWMLVEGNCQAPFRKVLQPAMSTLANLGPDAIAT